MREKNQTYDLYIQLPLRSGYFHNSSFVYCSLQLDWDRSADPLWHTIITGIEETTFVFEIRSSKQIIEVI